MSNSIHKIYKIRNKETGLFSKGGSDGWGIWTKEGKSWSNIGPLKNHIKQHLKSNGEKRKDYPYDNSEIVEIEVDYNQCAKIDVNEFIEKNGDKNIFIKKDHETPLEKTIKNLPAELSEEELNKGKSELSNYLNQFPYSYYMLMKPYITNMHYHTVFKVVNGKDMVDEIFDFVSTYLGKIQKVVQVGNRFDFYCDNQFYSLYGFDECIVEV